MREVIRSLILAAMVVASESGLEAAEAMSTYKWKYRPIVVFADSDDNANLAAQRRILTNNRAGFAERNMVVVLVVGDNVSAELGPEPHQSAAALRSRYGVTSNAFRAVLVGKDGGLKLSSSAPLSAAKLFATIDAMPMRRNEMRRR
jgi:hypothetical protein